ncbi:MULTISPECIES: YggT family protein [Campylobacter]|jgi:yggt family protein|uniref:YGGT family protein n=1 Tax=Campylobacter gracilis RM3268 TaxID=553220 RepID=C8PJR6_9BACT|nr:MULTISPECIES: YggT family protein [Campylobacter]AKT92218.1 putative membrane protein, YGGT family [Campylobacter gracilis]EEV17171.1 YGGT family protein [Campylobacter gracilis RM3268]UEB45594.1 YggT family protein [Campylobacter gracilis]SUW81734.1 yggt family protein [Campylobacter gracilis]
MLLNSVFYGILVSIHYVIQAYMMLIFVACVLSFIRPNPFGKFYKIVRVISALTEPAFALVRRYLPTTFGGFDLSPLVILFVLMFFDNMIIYILNRSVL